MSKSSFSDVKIPIDLKSFDKEFINNWMKI